MKLQVYSDINRLKTILLHRPDSELENLMPDNMQRLLFDDIPYLKKAAQEHDMFANLLLSKGVEILYVEDLISEVLEDSSLRKKFISEFIDESGLKSDSLKVGVEEFYSGIKNSKTLVSKLIRGIRTSELDLKKRSLFSMINSGEPLLIDPIPNLYFTRDSISVIGSGVSINKMSTKTRSREALFYRYIFEEHPHFKVENIRRLYDSKNKFSIEGGDILVLSEKVLAIGLSERTSADGIENLAKNIFSSDEPFETILAFDIPKKRSCMHLDTVFTMIDYDAFTIHPEIETSLSVYALHRTSDDGDYEIEYKKEELEVILADALDLKSVRLIRCGNGSLIDAIREQWNDGSNTLAIAPGEVIVYDRNNVTNDILRKNGIKTYEIDSSELSRGRGGPRCISMPLVREM